MARMRSQAAVPGGVLAHVKAELARLCDQWADWDLGYPCPWFPKLEQIDAGEPVDVYAWHLPGGGRAFGVEPGAYVRVAPDGSVSKAPVTRVRR